MLPDGKLLTFCTSLDDAAAEAGLLVYVQQYLGAGVCNAAGGNAWWRHCSAAVHSSIIARLVAG
jgi:hypothetical protein